MKLFCVYLKYLSFKSIISNEFQKKHLLLIVNLIDNYKYELRLLLFHSHSSSLENYRNEYTERYTKATVKYLAKLKSNYPKINTDISEFFIHTLGSWWLSTIGEIVTHEELDQDDIKRFISEHMTFYKAGWQKIIKIGEQNL